VQRRNLLVRHYRATPPQLQTRTFLPQTGQQAAAHQDPIRPLRQRYLNRAHPPTLPCQTLVADGRVGFLFGTGVFQSFLREYYRRGDNDPSALTAAETIGVPSLFVGGTDDPVLAFTKTTRAREVAIGPYRQVMLDGAGHWIQQERPNEITAELLTFLSEVPWT
jgi:pimeloyl-ACP methyl ester carboxylesterase